MKHLFTFFLFSMVWGLWGQDRSQALCFSHPQALSPSFAGLSESRFNFRATHRNQAMVNQAYSTSTAATNDNTLLKFTQTAFSGSLPLNAQLGSGGLGLLLVTETTDALRTTNFQLNGAYQIPLPAGIRYDFIRVGVNIGLLQRTLIDGNYQFEDQFRGRDFSGQTREQLNGLTTSAFDMGLGIHWYRTQKIKGNPEFTPFAGLSLSHITRPVLGFFANSEDPLAMRTTVTVGFKQRTRSPIDFNFASVYSLANQASFIILNAQARYNLYEDNVLFGNDLMAFIIGLTLRHRFSIAPMIGAEYKKTFTFGFTYEIMTDTNQLIGQSAGGYQLFLGYSFDPGAYKGTAMPFSNF